MIKNDGGTKSAADVARRAQETKRASETKQTTAQRAAAATRVTAFRADEMSAGRGGALRANATKLLGASGLSTARVDPPPPRPSTQPYVVQPGDTLTSIATQHNTTIPAIMSANPSLTNPNQISAGMTLQLPVSAQAPVVDPPPPTATMPYTVQSGDTLTSIAAQHGTTPQGLLDLNPQITNANQIQVGQVLTVPGTPTANPAAPVGPTGPVQGLPATTAQQNVVDIANGELEAWQNGEATNSTYYPAGGYGSADHAWCADFVSTVYQKAGLPLGDLQYPSLSGSASAPRLADWFAAGSATSDPYRVAIPADGTPKPGDVVFFGDSSGNSSSITHTAIVTKVYADGSFDTVEGNIGGTNDYDGGVGTRHYTAEDRSKVYGFGRRLQDEPPELRDPRPRFVAI